MPSRREFIAAVAGAALTGCSQDGGDAPPPAARKQASPQAKVGPKPSPKRAPTSPTLGLREEVMPPLHVTRDDTLVGIARVKPREAELIDVWGDDKAKMTRIGIEAIGGMSLIMQRGARVVITPNFAWAKPPSAAVTTSPEIVRELILMCQEAGAREIVCLDYATDMTPRAYRINKAYEAVAGTRARLLSPWSPEQYARIQDFDRRPLHRQKLSWQAVATALLRCDVLISAPIFKHHRLTGITGSLKKMMGCVWRRESYHRVGLDQCIAELGATLRPTLVVGDATRVLCSNGPDGPGRICEPERLIVSADPVLADAHACTLLKLKPTSVKHLVHAAKLGVGKLDLKAAKIEKVGVKG